MTVSNDNLSLRDIRDKYNRDVANFFNVEEINNISIHIFNTQTELKIYYLQRHPDRKVAPDYLVGFSPGNEVNIVGPEGMPPDRDPGEIRFQKVLKHEIAHKYIHLLNPNVPDWLEEGTCCYIADQQKDNVEINQINTQTLKELSRTHDPRKYHWGKSMVVLITDQYGKQKLLDLIQTVNEDELYNNLKKMFEWLK